MLLDVKQARKARNKQAHKQLTQKQAVKKALDVDR